MIPHNGTIDYNEESAKNSPPLVYFSFDLFGNIFSQMSQTESNPSEDDQEVVEYQRGISDGVNESGGSGGSGKNLRMYCFACHRAEYHYNALKGTAYHHLLIGLTFGMAVLFGPYRCRCCGYRRLCRYNFLNPKYHYHQWKYSGKTGTTPTTEVRRKRSSSSKETRTELESSSPKSEVRLVGDSGTDSMPRKRRRKKNKKLKTVPLIDSIGESRRQRARQERFEQMTVATEQVADFSIEGLMGSFETEESRKQRIRDMEEARATKDPFVGKKAKPRKKIKGQPKRRKTKKTKLTGPTIYCFRCHQNNEHYNVIKGTTYYFFLFGITFGLISLLGPFRCSCCSKKRLGAANFLNPKYFFRGLLQRSNNGYG
jgi:hypothetical protein